MGKQDPLEPFREALASMPGFLANVASRLDGPARLRPRPGGGFCFLEQVWHLADLEVLGYQARIERLLTEQDPLLRDFDGAAVARERDYRAQDLDLGLDRFTRARRRNLALLASAGPRDWDRGGRQEGVGGIRLLDLPRMMAAHDESHRDEIAEILGKEPGSGRSLVA